MDLRTNRTRMRAGAARLLFCLVAAVTAAALADPLVEWLSNRGAFGSGRLTDHSNADVMPVLAAALVFATLFIVGVVRRAVRRPGSGPTPAWIRDSRAAVSVRTALRLFPATFAVQIGTVFGAETLEQLAVAGHTLGGTVWLGGPVLVSLGLHAAIGILVVTLLARLLDWVAQSIIDVIELIRRLVLPWDSLSALPSAVAHLAPPRPKDVLAIAASRGRAPPPLSA